MKILILVYCGEFLYYRPRLVHTCRGFVWAPDNRPSLTTVFTTDLHSLPLPVTGSPPTSRSQSVQAPSAPSLRRYPLPPGSSHGYRHPILYPLFLCLLDSLGLGPSVARSPHFCQSENVGTSRSPPTRPVGPGVRTDGRCEWESSSLWTESVVSPSI